MREYDHCLWLKVYDASKWDCIHTACSSRPIRTGFCVIGAMLFSGALYVVCQRAGRVVDSFCSLGKLVSQSAGPGLPGTHSSFVLFVPNHSVRRRHQISRCLAEGQDVLCFRGHQTPCCEHLAGSLFQLSLIVISMIAKHSYSGRAVIMFCYWCFDFFLFFFFRRP